jgi:hypothetical protein
MHWSRRRRERQEVLRIQREQELLARLQVMVRELLWELALPLAEALHRQDSLAEERHRLLLGHLLVLQDQTETRGLLTQDLLLEVLGSLQPTAEEQLLSPLSLPSSSAS